jgi:hypothetical protein
MTTDNELQAALEQVRANLAAIDLEECRAGRASIRQARQRIDVAEKAARDRCDELRPTVLEIERVGATRYDEQSGGNAFYALLAGELGSRQTGDDLLREYRNLQAALSGAAGARRAQDEAERQLREADRAAIAAAMAPLKALAQQRVNQFADQLRETYALAAAAGSLARGRISEALSEAATAFRHQLGEVKAPPAIGEALADFEELLSLAKVAAPSKFSVSGLQPDFAMIAAVQTRAAAAN